MKVPLTTPGKITTGSVLANTAAPGSLRVTFDIILVKLITPYPIHDPVVKQATMYCPLLLTDKAPHTHSSIISDSNIHQLR